MMEEFEERKRQYISNFEEEHASSQKKRSWCSANDVVYTRTAEYSRKCKHKINLPEEIVVRNNLGRYLIPAHFIIMIAWGYLPQSNENVVKFFVSLGLFVLLIAIAIFLQTRPGNKTMIWLNKEGIWMTKTNRLIKWEHVAMTLIKKTTDSDDTTYTFQLHYFDEEYQYFKFEEMSMSGLAISNEKLSYMIETVRNR